MSTISLFPKDTEVYTIAHRGARSCAPENTLAAARCARQQGAEMWELDVGFSADGIPMVLHDDTLERTTDVAARPELAGLAPWRVCDLTCDEIRRLDAGRWFGATDPFGTIASGTVSVTDLEGYSSCQVPTLEEALRYTREQGWLVNVELKDHARLKGHTSVTARVVALIRELEMVGAVLFSSFQHRYLAEARALLPELARGLLVEQQRPADPLTLCREYAAAAYHPEQKLVTKQDISRLRAAGVQVNVWTVNEPAVMRELAEQGASGLITDYPAVAHELLNTLQKQA